MRSLEEKAQGVLSLCLLFQYFSCYWLVYHQYIILDESILLEDYEKLKVKVADLTELLGEKEEQYLKEKQIIIG